MSGSQYSTQRRRSSRNKLNPFGFKLFHNLQKIQETGYFSDLQVYMKEDNKAYKPDERDSFQS